MPSTHNFQNMYEVYEMMDASIMVGKNLALELPLKKYGTWQLTLKKVEPKE